MRPEDAKRESRWAALTRRNMKFFELWKPVVGFGVFFYVMSAMSGIGNGDTGASKAVRKAVGNAVETSVLTGSSYTGTNFLVARSTRPDAVMFNNTATTVWIGSVTATTLTTVVHNNIMRGLAVPASAYFDIDGSLTSALAFTCNKDVSTCEVRVLEGVTQ